MIALLFAALSVSQIHAMSDRAETICPTIVQLDNFERERYLNSLEQQLSTDEYRLLITYCLHYARGMNAGSL